MRVELYLASGKHYYMECSLEEFTSDFLGPDGSFKDNVIGISKDNKEDAPSILIYTKHIVSIEEVEK
ncbi:hypothetical protein [Lysinibacillus sp. NPDC096212]|uniref:hypothetical protein n=1 Tax=Lysinibacillus sp. NPDC096212 TaxID=3364135 RepID=UPI003825DC3F